MTYPAHQVVKPQVIADTGVELLSEKLDILNRFTKEVPDQFFGADGDKVTVRVPGTLPVRQYGWRNDRANPIQTDEYRETTVDITVNANNIYSAVKLTDEQKAFDFNGSFGRMTDAQTNALAEKMNHNALGIIKNLPFELVKAVKTTEAEIKRQAELGRDVYFNAFVDAGQALTRMRVPFDERTALVGMAVAAELKKSQKLIQVTGDNSGSAFASAVIGNYAGFTIIEDPTVDPDEALLVSKSGIVMWNYAPAIPEGATKGATATKNGVSMRWLVDYDAGYQLDRSTWSTWSGFRHVEDMLSQINEDETQRINGTEKYFLRGAKINFKDGNGGYEPGDGGANTNNRKGASPDSELAKVWNNQPFAGTLPAGDDYHNVLRTVAQRQGGGDAGGGESGD